MHKVLGAVGDRLPGSRDGGDHIGALRILGADDDVIAVGVVVVAVGNQRRHAVPKAQLAARLDARRAHAAHVLQRIGRAHDTHRSRDRQQAVAEVDEIARQHAVEDAAVVAQAGLVGIRLFGLEERLDRIEPGLAGGERPGRGGRSEGARHLREAGEGLDRRRDAVRHARMRLKPVAGRERAGRAAASHDRRGAGRLVRGHDRRHLGIAQLDLVHHIVLIRLGAEIDIPLGEERIMLEFQVIAPRIGAAGIGIEAAGLIEVVVFEPAADGDVVHPQIGVQAGENAAPLDVVLGGAQCHRHAGRAVDIRRAPSALAFVVVIISAGLEGDARGQFGGQPDRCERVAAQARCVVVGIVDGLDLAGIDRACRRIERHGAAIAAIGGNIGHLNGQRILAGAEVVPTIAQTIDLAEAEVLIVLLGAVRIAERTVERDRTDRHHALGVHVELALLAITLPLVGGGIDHRGEGARAIARADPAAQEPAPGVVRTIRPAGVDAERVLRIDRGEAQRAAKIVGRLRIDCARTLADDGAADVFRRDRAADVEAVVVAIRHIAERDAIEIEAQLVLVEPAQGDAGGPFIGPERIGRLEVDRRQLGDGAQGAGAGGLDGEIRARKLLDLAGLAGAVDDDGIAVAGLGRGSSISFGSSRRGLRFSRREGGAVGGGEGRRGEQQSGKAHIKLPHEPLECCGR